MSNQTIIANKPTKNGSFYRYNGRIYRWGFCLENTHICNGHPIEMKWVPKELSLENKIALFTQFLEHNNSMLTKLELYPIPNDPLNLYLRFKPELDAAFNCIRNKVLSIIKTYNGSPYRYINKHFKQDYINRFLTGKKDDLVEAKYILDVLQLAYNLVQLSYRCNPNSETKRTAGLYREHLDTLIDSYNIVNTNYCLIHENKVSQDVVLNIIKPMFVKPNATNIQDMSQTIASQELLDLVEPVADHNVLFYTNTGIAITQEDLENFDFNPVYNSDNEDGYDDYDW